MNLIFFEGDAHAALFPLTLTRPVAAIRVGILTIFEKWERRFQRAFAQNGGAFAALGYHTADYLAPLFPLRLDRAENWLVDASVLPDDRLIEQICKLPNNSVLAHQNRIIAAKADADTAQRLLHTNFSDTTGLKMLDFSGDLLRIGRVWDIFMQNHRALEVDFELLTADRVSQPISDSNRVLGDRHRIFLEAGAQVEASVLNPQNGPIYLARNAEIMEGCLVRGGLALGEGAGLKMGAKIYGATTIGPHSKVGGEVNNSVIFGFSNKAHDGFLGNSVLGEWCNLGADTNNSNLKNNYSAVEVWDYPSKSYRPSGLQFCGLFMGDHSKSGINTMFNTGTSVGAFANVFGAGFPPKFVPSFAWGGAEGFVEHQFDKAIATARAVWARRGKQPDPIEESVLRDLFNCTADQRQ